MFEHRVVLRAIAFPFRLAWNLILMANFLVVAASFALIAAFTAYALVLVGSYLFLSPDWTLAIWGWAADLYAQSNWFKAAVIVAFLLVLFPILGFWPGRVLNEERDRELRRLNDDLVAARQRDCR
jgi:hypothetical protein